MAMRLPVTLFLVCGLLLFVDEHSRGQNPKTIDVQVVKYDGLKEAVLKNRGKVVVVDFWSTTCIPCIRNFPHMIEMQEKYGKDGLVLISVSLDPLAENEKAEQRKERVLGWLRKLKANIVNLILDEHTELLKEKLRIVTIPSVYVFNRQGQWTHFSSDDGGEVSPAAVEALAVKWLKEK
jgi:thiol-disulfide isomerase/thioredoxin